MTSSIEEPKNILIVEDNIEWAKFLKEILPGNFQFDHVCTIKDIELLLRKKTYDLVIADLLLSEEDYVIDLFQDFNKLIFAIKQTNPHKRLWPPIIVTTIHEVYPRIPSLINRYGGWIWGWHEKDKFDVDEFHHNVETALQTKETFEENLKMPDEWTFRDLLSHLTLQAWGAIAGIIGLLLTLAYYVGVLTP